MAGWPPLCRPRPPRSLEGRIGDAQRTSQPGHDTMNPARKAPRGPGRSPLEAPAAANPELSRSSTPLMVQINGLNVVPDSAVIVRMHAPRAGAYVLQAADDLSKPTWVNVSTNDATAVGPLELRDADAARWPARYYRIAIP